MEASEHTLRSSVGGGSWISSSAAHRRCGEGDAPGRPGRAAPRRRGACVAAAALLLVCAALPACTAITCYTGLQTVGTSTDLNTDPAYWLQTANDATLAEPQNCTLLLSEQYDQCSLFCRTYRSLISSQLMNQCRRFCLPFVECNRTAYLEKALCDQFMLAPSGNHQLIACVQKCSFVSMSNSYASCRKEEGGLCMAQDTEFVAFQGFGEAARSASLSRLVVLLSAALALTLPLLLAA